MSIQFPPDFLWGAATSSYQVEGQNDNADWWHWEKKAGKVNSGQACDHYHLYEKDFDLAKSLNHNAHRLSVEWARIEPEPGRFSSTEIQHYIDVLKALKVRQIQPMVTLHHFTNPMWLSQQGGWENPRCVEYFIRFTREIVGALAQYVPFWITINEPTIYSSHSYIFGNWPPQGKSVQRALAVQDNQIKAHIRAYQAIHEIYRRQNLSRPAVSISHHVAAIVACQDNFRNRFAVKLRDQVFNYWVLDCLARANSLDYIGLNYYSRQLVETNSWLPGNLFAGVCDQGHHPVKKNFLGWDIYPQGIKQVILKLMKYKRPIYITENGICTQNDQERFEFIVEHLRYIHQAMQEGADVRGYLHWSLLDNFEWDKGFAPRFGLIDIDYATQQRTPRESAKKYAQICKNGTLEGMVS